MKIRAHKVVPAYIEEGKIFGFMCLDEDWPVLTTILDKYKKDTLLIIEIKKFVPRRTKLQLGIFWLAWDYYCKKMGHLDDSERDYLYQGFKEKYALRRVSGLYNDDGSPILVTIGLSEANCRDHFEALFQGLFHLMESDNVDYTEFLASWEAWKREQEAIAKGNTDQDRREAVSSRT